MVVGPHNGLFGARRMLCWLTWPGGGLEAPPHSYLFWHIVLKYSLLPCFIVLNSACVIGYTKFEPNGCLPASKPNRILLQGIQKILSPSTGVLFEIFFFNSECIHCLGTCGMECATHSF